MSVADHLHLMAERFAILTSTIAKVTCVNNTLEELIANDSTLAEGFGRPEDPIVKFNTEDFKQAVREAVISSEDIIDSIKSIAKYASNANHIQRIKEDLNQVPEQDPSCQKLKSYLTVINQRVGNCRKLIEEIQPIYKKVHNVMLKCTNPPLESVATVTSTVPMLQRIVDISASTIFRFRRIVSRSTSTVFRFRQRIFDIAYIMVMSAVLAHALYPMLKQHNIKLPVSEFRGSPGVCPFKSPFLLQQHVTCGLVEPQTYYLSSSWHSMPSPSLEKSGSVRMYILGIVCLGCGILGLGFFLIRRAFGSGERDEECSISKPSAPPTTTLVTLQSAGVAVSAFLTTLENFKSQLLDLEECVGEAAKCQNSGSIREIKEQLQKVQADMESILAAASDVV